MLNYYVVFSPRNVNFESMAIDIPPSVTQQSAPMVGNSSLSASLVLVAFSNAKPEPSPQATSVAHGTSITPPGAQPLVVRPTWMEDHMMQ